MTQHCQLQMNNDIIIIARTLYVLQNTRPELPATFNWRL